MIGRHYGSLIIYLIGIPMIVIAWYRAKNNGGYYYAREILKHILNYQETREKVRPLTNIQFLNLDTYQAILIMSQQTCLGERKDAFSIG